MSNLHTVNKSPFERSNLDSCLNHATAGDAILLIEDAVYGALQGNAFSARMADAAKQFKVFVLGPDLEARGMDASGVIDGVIVVDYAGFVDLAAENKAVHAWL